MIVAEFDRRRRFSDSAANVEPVKNDAGDAGATAAPPDMKLGDFGLNEGDDDDLLRSIDQAAKVGSSGSMPLLPRR